MHATDLFDKTIGPACQWMHKARLDALKAAVEAAMIARGLSVTGLGRVVRATSEKNGIKRMDRLIGNNKLQAEAMDVYGAMAMWRLKGQERPIILIDWSPLKEDNSLHLLSAYLPSLGRGLPLCQEVHPESLVGNGEVQGQFLDTLQGLVPTECRPIIVTDGGFKNPWFRAVEAKGWDWLGRIRGTTKLTRSGEEAWVRCTKVAALLPRNKATYLGNFLLAESNRLPCSLYGLKSPPKGRVDRTAHGHRARSRKSRVNAARESEPWLLATSLPAGDTLTGLVIATYRKRMQIEEGFRDTKDERYGLGLDMSLSKSKERYTVLLLIAALAVFIAWLFGKVAYQRKLHLKYQANTVTHRRVLSFVFFGVRIARGGGMSVAARDIVAARNSLREAHAFCG